VEVLDRQVELVARDAIAADLRDRCIAVSVAAREREAHGGADRDGEDSRNNEQALHL
jgi:hypothetical protein